MVYKLHGNCKRIYFKNATIIPKIYIYKHTHDSSSNSSIIILIATTSKLYRLIFPVSNIVIFDLFIELILIDSLNKIYKKGKSFGE